MKIKKILAIAVATTLVAGAFVGCGSKKDITGDATGDSKSSGEEIYFLNFKPEIADVYKKIAKDYEAETGVKIKVETAASGTYEQTLKSEIAKKDAPTIFQINGPIGYESWKDYCLDLKDIELYDHLLDKSLAVTSGDGVYGIPYAVEGYGIIYNDEIMQKYFALENKATDFKSMDDINNFHKLKEVVEDMEANKDKLGIQGVFASTSMAAGNAWRWETHLANIPLYYEFKDQANEDSDVLQVGLDSNEIKFKYNENFKNIYDLYTDNSISEKGILGNKSVDDAMAEFALGDCAMVQNGNWAWAQINGIDGNMVKEKYIKFMPIYTGMDGEENQGLCIGTENYLAINSQASEEKKQASIDFINWLFTSNVGKAYVTDDLGFIAPFDTFNDDEKPADPLSKEVINWMEKENIATVNWVFQSFPSQNFKDTFSGALLEYIQGTQDWDYVVKTVKDSWKSERSE